MKEKNMNASQFSDAIGIQRATISHIIAGRNNPSLDMVMKILTKFPEISPDWLLWGKEPMKRSLQENIGNNSISGITELALSDDLFSLPNFPLTDKKKKKKKIKRSENAIKNPATTEKPKTHAGIHSETEFAGNVCQGGGVYNYKLNPDGIANETIVCKKYPSKTIDKLLIFYSDNTFESFIPEKHNK